ncbi:MAG: aminotransferase class I/II-fold pyridoxal phosphate-dependent enzyme [Candidatus Palauibacterales bacterium]|nr:aminotransferase class I/II-fold pyridoxal phosphate-dependent enzyme [Candidatus Palauibacterales bacterium]MDP2528818.1 aminotransferase class I/II-fold pyridoxal phosphate-dependent enzyme [Candidatus Palauibacterales bacterium]
MPIDPADVAICLEDEAPDEGGASTPMAPPIVQTSLFSFRSFQDLLAGLADEGGHHVYTRGSNPTAEAAERKIAALERGEACRTFGSGMAAISAVLSSFLAAGDHVLFVNHTYGPALQLAGHLERFGVAHDVTLELAPAAVEAALRSETRLVWLESPGTMTFRLADVPAIAAICRERGVLTCMDNSWSTPMFQKPLAVGVDIVVHSATKYLAGHSDLVAGAAVTSEALMGPLFEKGYMLGGGILAPFEAWLLHRGLRTLPVRLARHEADALRVASFLADHPAVRRVHHPALAEGEEGERSRRQLAGTSGLFSFELARGTFESVRSVLDALERFHLGVSWGGVESLAISPENGRNASELAEMGLPRGLIRLSVGLEGADPLIDDLDRALARLA